jgi:hypothetical protein
VRAYRHSWRRDAEIPAYASPQRRHGHQGTIGAAVNPVVSGNPNIRFMFWTA